MIIVPAPLENEVGVLMEDVNHLSPFFSRFQIDVGDGKFVNNTTATIGDFVTSLVCTQNQRNTVFDFHLMVEDPKKSITEIQKLPLKNVGTIFIHKKVFVDMQLNRFGLVLSPEDKVEELTDEYLSILPAIQIMTVYPGFQGRPFLPETLIKIEQLRKGGFRGEILLDGGINPTTISSILQGEYMPDVLCIGSFLTKSPQEKLEERITQLNSIIGSKE